MTEQATSPNFIIWRVVEADGTLGEPGRCMTVDGLLSWDREAEESADAFERRTVADAVQSLRHALIMVPRCADDLATTGGAR